MKVYGIIIPNKLLPGFTTVTTSPRYGSMLCAAVGLDNHPRIDHAKYLNSWVRGLRDQPEALFKAAGKASKAAQYLWSAAAAQDAEAA